MIKKYIKTTPVEAIQVTEDNHEETKEFAFLQRIVFCYGPIRHSIDTLEGKCVSQMATISLRTRLVNAMYARKKFLRKHINYWRIKMEAYKERMVNEHKELQRRTVKLGELLDNYRQGKLDFELNCPVTLLEQQFGAMCVYLVVLERRAEIEGIEL